jgi:hypothetical protein
MSPECTAAPPTIYENAAPVKNGLAGIDGLLPREAVSFQFNWPLAYLR